MISSIPRTPSQSYALGLVEMIVPRARYGAASRCSFLETAPEQPISVFFIYKRLSEHESPEP